MHNRRNGRWAARGLIAVTLFSHAAATSAGVEWHCTYTDDPEVYECRSDEPLRSQAELEAEAARHRAEATSRAASAAALPEVARLSPAAALSQLAEPVDDVSAMSAETLALGATMLQAFESYAEVATEAVRDTATPEPTRLMLLEVLEGNWDDPRARNAIEDVFADAAPSSTVAAYAALALAKRGTDLSGPILDRYPDLAPPQRGTYLRALAATGAPAATALALERLDAASDARDLERLVSAEVLGKLASADDPEVSPALRDTILTYGRTEADHGGAVPDDAIAMRAVAALGRIGGPENIERLLAVAADEHLTTDTRLSAVEALGRHVGGTPTIAARLRTAAEAFSASERPLSDRERFQLRVEGVLR